MQTKKLFGQVILSIPSASKQLIFSNLSTCLFFLYLDYSSLALSFSLSLLFTRSFHSVWKTFPHSTNEFSSTGLIQLRRLLLVQAVHIQDPSTPLYHLSFPQILRLLSPYFPQRMGESFLHIVARLRPEITNFTFFPAHTQT